jgi:phosphocarrier protein
MSDKYCIRHVTVVNPQGLHARPAHAFVTLANQFQSNIEIIKDGEPVDGKSILSILTLAAVHGSHLALRATGDDAAEAIEALAGLIEQGFDECDEQHGNGQAQDVPAQDLPAQGERQSPN